MCVCVYIYYIYVYILYIYMYIYIYIIYIMYIYIYYIYNVYIYIYYINIYIAVGIRPAAGQDFIALFVRHFLFAHVKPHVELSRHSENGLFLV